ncbi:hypothetical protein LAZ67_8003707 [Cordylochernes scorpioides]|uniref:Reverse transcriptase domain-containing protein n=1 Tax=Cordylochernes scorpioides TaxID=51811 RepID=A0ABY6KUJ5_9ARAC|nr:hypothetical protein LAZ67_8003707 [Cordylochernes scorpioides]
MKLDNIMKDISLKIKKRIVEALVFSVVTYGCESWTLRKEERKIIEAFEIWTRRKLLRTVIEAATVKSPEDARNKRRRSLSKLKSKRLELPEERKTYNELARRGQENYQKVIQGIIHRLGVEKSDHTSLRSPLDPWNIRPNLVQDSRGSPECLRSRDKGLQTRMQRQFLKGDKKTGMCRLSGTDARLQEKTWYNDCTKFSPVAGRSCLKVRD